VFFLAGEKKAVWERRRLFVVGDLDDVADDGVPDGDEQVGEAGVAAGGGFAQDRDAAGEENEEKEENGAGEDDAEDELARRNPASGLAGRRGWHGWRSGWDHCGAMRRGRMWR
jgi:hypothetical protein